METSFVVVVTIVLAVAFTVLHGNNFALQPPGQRTAALPGKTSGPAESAGLSASPGLPQRDYK